MFTNIGFLTSVNKNTFIQKGDSLNKINKSVYFCHYSLHKSPRSLVGWHMALVK